MTSNEILGSMNRELRDHNERLQALELSSLSHASKLDALRVVVGGDQGLGATGISQRIDGLEGRIDKMSDGFNRRLSGIGYVVLFNTIVIIISTASSFFSR